MENPVYYQVWYSQSVNDVPEFRYESQNRADVEKFIDDQLDAACYSILESNISWWDTI